MLAILYWVFIGFWAAVAVVSIVALGLAFHSAKEYEGYL